MKNKMLYLLKNIDPEDIFDLVLFFMGIVMVGCLSFAMIYGTYYHLIK